MKYLKPFNESQLFKMYGPTSFNNEYTDWFREFNKDSGKISQSEIDLLESKLGIEWSPYLHCDPKFASVPALFDKYSNFSINKKWTFTICKNNDEWFLISLYFPLNEKIKADQIKCDQMDGLMNAIKYIKEKIN
jgi:hypothetical protein